MAREYLGIMLLNSIQHFSLEIALEAKAKRALLVGVNKYNDRKISNLNFCVNDVTSVHRILTSPERGGFDPNSCYLMVDDSKEDRFKPIRSNLMSSIKSLSKIAKSDDYLLFFFSGHGMEENGKSYLLPADASARVSYLRIVNERVLLRSILWVIQRRNGQ